MKLTPLGSDVAHLNRKQLLARHDELTQQYMRLNETAGQWRHRAEQAERQAETLQGSIEELDGEIFDLKAASAVREGEINRLRGVIRRRYSEENER